MYEEYDDASETALALHDSGHCNWRCPYCGGEEPGKKIELLDTAQEKKG